MRKLAIVLIPLLIPALVIGAFGCGEGGAPTLTATRTATPTATLSPTATPTPTAILIPPSMPEVAEVLRVIDGDTIVLLGGERVRYIGIDTPEVGQCYYQEATDKNIRLVGGETVRLEKDVSETDIYGRLLRYVYVDDVFVNAELVRLGYAEAYPYPPDTKYAPLFVELEQEARAEAKGMWGVCATPTPEPSIGAGDVQIVYIFYDGLVPYVESDEYVEIKNLGSEAQDLAGWVLRDISEGYPSFTFPNYILQPGETIRVYTNEIHPEWGSFSFGYGKAIWNNTQPDTAALYDDERQEVSRKSY